MIYDRFNIEINIGSTVAVARASHSNAWIEIGEVIDLILYKKSGELRVYPRVIIKSERGCTIIVQNLNKILIISVSDTP